MTTPAEQQVVTGWPPGLLQDDSRRLSRWLAARPNAPAEAREVAESIATSEPKVDTRIQIGPLDV